MERMKKAGGVRALSRIKTKEERACWWLVKYRTGADTYGNELVSAPTHASAVAKVACERGIPRRLVKEVHRL